MRVPADSSVFIKSAICKEFVFKRNTVLVFELQSKVFFWRDCKLHDVFSCRQYGFKNSFLFFVRFFTYTVFFGFKFCEFFNNVSACIVCDIYKVSVFIGHKVLVFTKFFALFISKFCYINLTFPIGYFPEFHVGFWNIF